MNRRDFDFYFTLFLSVAVFVILGVIIAFANRQRSGCQRMRYSRRKVCYRAWHRALH